METCPNIKKESIVSNIITESENEDESPVRRKEDMIELLNALFKYGYSDLPSTILPNMSEEERHSALQSVLKRAKIASNKRPSMIQWLKSDIFGNEEFNIPLALLLIGLYEHYPSSKQENENCNFREIYIFLHKMTMNQTASHLSHKSAEILYKLLSELIDEFWPNMQSEFLHYLSNMHIYSRSEVRRTYSGRKILKRKAAKNCSS